MEFKTTTKLFHGKYQYKVVLVCPGAQVFRSGDSKTILEALEKISVGSGGRRGRVTSQEELDYAFKLQHALTKLQDFSLRVESPWISIYTNTKKDLDFLCNLNTESVKYVCKPSSILEKDTVIMPKMAYDYKITLGKTTQENSTFISWAEANPKIKIPKATKRELLKSRTYGGKHFYLSGDKNLMLARMHLGDSVARIENIVKK
jgi:hypothetical protein